MWINKIKISLLVFGLALLGISINFHHPVEIEYPASWPAPVYDFDKNPLTEEAIALGRKLFYESLLSKDGTVNCSNCQLSFTAFTHVDHALSHGIGDRIGNRNSMALTNLAWSKSFMWDGAVNHLDVQALAPISHPAEMGEDIAQVVQKLQATEIYPPLFYAAFRDSVISGAHLLKALSQFQLTLISANAKYDQVMRGEEGVAFSAQENQGFALFKTHCQTCHPAPLFTTGDFVNNGLPMDTTLQDQGRMTVTNQAKDFAKFKVPTLRNIEFSRPYMHDGRFETLMQVLDHYTNGIESNATLAPQLQNGISLSEKEQVDLIAFLLTLSDKTFLLNPDFAYPR